MMNKEMNAIELAERLEGRPQVYAPAAADMLRRQHEAIKQLREALMKTGDYDICTPKKFWQEIRQVLKDTEGL